LVLAPNFFLKIEQYLHERKIEKMHEYPAYAKLSKILRSYIPPKVRVLDLGCNKGLETMVISKTNSVVGIDFFSSFVRIARKRGVEAYVMDFHQLKFFEEFDCVYANNVLEHARFPEKVIKKVHQALKKGGLFIIGMPLDGYNLRVKDPAHFFRATEKDVFRLLEKEGFNIFRKEVIDTKKRWNWEIPPSNNKFLICVAEKAE
jgi:SAM-dependent methyltransferase